MSENTESKPEKILFFHYPYIADTDPMMESEFYKWLDESDDPPSKFVDALKMWLGKRGFDITLHFIDSTQLRTHKSTFEHFWWRQFHCEGGRHYEVHQIRRREVEEGKWMLTPYSFEKKAGE